MNAFLRTAIACGTTLLLSSCGGGSGGNGVVGAALVSIQASPHNLDTGDRTVIELQISEVHEEGIKLKLRFPKQLEYIANSAKLVVTEDPVAINPAVNVQSESLRYVVFLIPRDALGDDNSGSLSLQLEAGAALKEGIVSVDADVGSINDFNAAQPEFSSAGEVEINVAG